MRTAGTGTVARARLAPVFVIAAFQALLLGIALARLAATRASVLGLDECLACQAATLLQHEAGLWALAWLLLLGATAAWRAVRFAAVGALMVLLLVLVADLVTMDQFGLRLYLADAFKFGQQPRFIVAYLDDAAGGLWVPLLLGVAVLAPWWTLRLARKHLARPGARVALVALAAASLLAYLLPDRTAHPLPWTYQNLVEANWPSGVDRPFSDAYLADLLSNPPPALTAERCDAGLARAGDVIVVAVESLSWYHSGLLLGDGETLTPRLDAAAAQGAWWDRFLANGFTTDHGLIAMLAGRLPLPAVNRYRSRDVFAGFDGGGGSLPRRLAADGYHTAFLTSGDLGFLGKGAWLDSLGFAHVEGHEAQDYEGEARYAFGAVNDELLYRRVLRWLDEERPGGAPVFAFVETVSTHPPFAVPGADANDEAGAFRFADHALGAFIDALDARGFFSEGLLIVTSDQRALTPLRAAELEAFGPEAGARLPLVMLGDRLPVHGRQSVAGQMMDLPASLDWYLTERSCRRPDQGNLFAGEAPECIYRPDGNERDLIRASCGPERADIEMDGDDTRVVEGRLPDAERRLRMLNYLRARLGVQDPNAGLVL